MKPIFGSDFETTNDPVNPVVWLWTIYGEGTKLHGTTIETWYETIQTLGKCQMYFHNLSHDASYIISDLYLDKEVNMTYFTINKRYARIKIGEVEILDSLNFFNMTLAAVGKSLNLPKLEGNEAIAQMSPPLKIEQSWIDYALRDSEIVYKAMTWFIKWIGEPELVAMTLSSTAFRVWDKTQGKHHRYKSHRRSLPRLSIEQDDFIRLTYYGGITQVNPQHQNKLLEVNGISIDINSSYPHKMKELALPYGRPIEIKTDDYQMKKDYIDFLEVYISVKLKKNKVPCIFKSKGQYVDQGFYTEYSGILHLTSIDLETYMDSYDIIDFRVLRGLRFKTSKGFFDSYMDRFLQGKTDSKLAGNDFEYLLNKIMMNALSGKFGQNPHHLEENVHSDGSIKFGDETISEPYYTPLIAAVTAYGRQQLVTTGNKLGFDIVAYMDTDSLYLTTDVIEGINLDPYELGAWDIETHWTRGRFMVAKRYIVEESDGNLKVRAGGFSRKSMQKQATIENFVNGTFFETIRSNNTGRNHKRYIEVVRKEMKEVSLKCTTGDDLGESYIDNQGGEPVIDCDELVIQH